MERVGVYVPGGKAVYPSSVLMNIDPGQSSRGRSDRYDDTAWKRRKSQSVHTGGSKRSRSRRRSIKWAVHRRSQRWHLEQRVIPKVDKIVGPGNIYVALAKKAVYGYVSIDSIAGPSEILVLADETANPRFVAADLLSQAEHDEMASAILVTTSMELAEQVSEEVDGFVESLSRKEIIQKSLEQLRLYSGGRRYGRMRSHTANEIASEHLEIVTANPFEVMTKIRNAGAIFIGEYSSEPLGDYFAGPNHVLPTNGTSQDSSRR